MQRTQIMLREAQYQALREQARLDRKSMGELIRDFVDLGLSTPKAKAAQRRTGLCNLKGLFSKPGLRGRDHDRHLYGESR